MTKPAAKHKLPPHIKRKLMEMLDSNIKILPNEECELINDITEDMIAEQCGVTKWMVQETRRQFYGNIIGIKRGGNSPMEHAFRRIDALEHALAELRQELAELRKVGANRFVAACLGEQ